jgi:hypothetical protein
MGRNINLRLTDEQYRDIAKWCKSEHPYLPVTTALRTICLTMLNNVKQGLTSLNDVKQELAPLPLGDARAHSVISEETDRQTDKIDQSSEVAEAIKAADWRNMKLPKAHSVESYSEILVSAYPAAATAATIRDAAMWVLNNPHKSANKKYLGGFLTNWCKRHRADGQSSFGSDYQKPSAQMEAGRKAAEKGSFCEGTDNRPELDDTTKEPIF